MLTGSNHGRKLRRGGRGGGRQGTGTTGDYAPTGMGMEWRKGFHKKGKPDLDKDKKTQVTGKHADKKKKIFRGWRKRGGP